MVRAVLIPSLNKRSYRMTTYNFKRAPENAVWGD